MPLSTAAKAALCLCPPAVIAGTVATVPAAKRVAHHLTAPHHTGQPVRRIATAATRPAAEPVAAGCDPVAPGPLPAQPLVTYAAPIPDEPGDVPASNTGGTGGSAPGGATIVGGQAPVGPIGTGVLATPVVTPTVTVPLTNPDTSAPTVPEPASWLMMIVGAGALGTVIRRRRRGAATARRPAAVGATLWAGSAAEAGDAAATAAVQSGTAKSVLATVAGKAMLCACPAAVAAGSVVAVPPLRHAVYTATMPTPAPLVRSLGVPCDPPAAMPISAAAVTDFPATVSTAVRAAPAPTPALAVRTAQNPV